MAVMTPVIGAQVAVIAGDRSENALSVGAGVRCALIVVIAFFGFVTACHVMTLIGSTQITIITIRMCCAGLRVRLNYKNRAKDDKEVQSFHRFELNDSERRVSSSWHYLNPKQKIFCRRSVSNFW